MRGIVTRTGYRVQRKYPLITYVGSKGERQDYRVIMNVLDSFDICLSIG